MPVLFLVADGMALLGGVLALPLAWWLVRLAGGPRTGRAARAELAWAPAPLTGRPPRRATIVPMVERRC